MITIDGSKLGTQMTNPTEVRTQKVPTESSVSQGIDKKDKAWQQAYNTAQYDLNSGKEHALRPAIKKLDDLILCQLKQASSC